MILKCRYDRTSKRSFMSKTSQLSNCKHYYLNNLDASRFTYSFGIQRVIFFFYYSLVLHFLQLDFSFQGTSMGRHARAFLAIFGFYGAHILSAWELPMYWVGSSPQSSQRPKRFFPDLNNIFHLIEANAEEGIKPGWLNINKVLLSAKNIYFI